MSSDERGPDAPSDEELERRREELLAHYADLKVRAEALRERVEAQQQGGGVKISRVLLLFGLPIAGGVGAYVVTASILWAVLATIGLFVGIVAVALRVTPSAPGPGTRAWEAGMTARLLNDVIAARRGEQTSADPKRRAYLDREIEFLGRQRRECLAIAASGDTSPGQGYVGFKPYEGG